MTEISDYVNQQRHAYKSLNSRIKQLLVLEIIYGTCNEDQYQDGNERGTAIVKGINHPFATSYTLASSYFTKSPVSFPNPCDYCVLPNWKLIEPRLASIPNGVCSCDLPGSNLAPEYLIATFLNFEHDIRKELVLSEQPTHHSP